MKKTIAMLAVVVVAGAALCAGRSPVHAAKTQTTAAAVPVPQDYGRNLDAMYDMFTEYGNEWRIEFRNSVNVPEAFRQVCMDAAADTPGLEIVFG